MAKPKVAIQGGGPNYLGKQPTVSGVPKKWKSSPDHPTAELAYITKKEKAESQKESNLALNHWILQKISALVLIPLVCWFLFTFKDFLYKDYSSKIIWFKNYTNSFLFYCSK